MSFLVPLGLLVALAVVGPLVAHLLRRRRPQERVFPPARLVPMAPPVARRRAHIEDRLLLSLRACAIAALAFLAAAPLVRCSRLSLDRRGGASVALAIVVDDSMSMRAVLPEDKQRGGAKTRFDLAMLAAQELASSLRSGDVTTIVLAGAPARVALPPSGEPGAVRAMLEQLAREGASDRATDLDGAIALAASSLKELPHADRRVVLLSDLADGNATGAAIGVPPVERLSLEAPLDALRAPPKIGSADCAVIAATAEGDAAIRVRLTCALAGAALGRRAIEIVTVDAAHAVLGNAAFPASIPPAPATFEVVVAVDKSKVPSLAPAADKPSLAARITGETDAIESDDSAPVLGVATAPIVGVVVGEGGALDEVVATGGPPILERALSALESGAAIRPLPSIPDREVDLAPFAALAIDDPPGLGPESREAIAGWVEKGGVLLLATGPRAASPPLGQSIEPFVVRPLKWEKLTIPLGVDPAHGGPLGDGATVPKDLAAKGRSVLDPEDLSACVVTATFTDGVPLVLTRAMGQGEAWLVTLPFAPDVSDLPLRPSFLAMLDAFVTRAEDRGAGARLEIGKSWTAGPEDALDVVALDVEGKPTGANVAVDRNAGAARVAPRTVGAYLVTTTPKGGAPRRDVRAVTPAPREVDLAPRALEPAVIEGAKSGLQRTTAELSPLVAWGLLLLFLGELGVRVWRIVSPKPSERDDESPPSVAELPPPTT